MRATLREQLAAEFASERHKLLLYKKGRKHPPFNDLSVEQTYEKFLANFLPFFPLTDRLGRSVKVGKQNFRKLAGLEHKTLGKISAKQVVEEIENGSFDICQYDVEKDRIRTLFWIPEILTDPDAVYDNNHSVVRADHIFICVYDKLGSNVKLVFTATFGSKSTARVEIVTSYLTDAKGALSCIGKKPTYLRS